jgi:hypothetical protein
MRITLDKAMSMTGITEQYDLVTKRPRACRTEIPRLTDRRGAQMR